MATLSVRGEPAKAGPTFPFFKLAPELRNIVYDHALVSMIPLSRFKGETVPILDPRQSSFRSKTMSVFAMRVPMLSLLLVSRQFRSEYRACAEDSAHLRFEHNMWAKLHEIEPLPEALQWIRHWDLHLHFMRNVLGDAGPEVERDHDCKYIDFIHYHRTIIRRYLNMYSFRGTEISTSISAYISPGDVFEEELVHHTGRLSSSEELPLTLTSLNVYMGSFHHNVERPHDSSCCLERRLMLSYNPATKELEPAADLGEHLESLRKYNEAHDWSETEDGSEEDDENSEGAPEGGGEVVEGGGGNGDADDDDLDEIGSESSVADGG